MATKILIVEDEEAFVDALTVSLQREGFTIDVARDGAEALDMFDTSKPDLVLLDVMLPVMSGVDVCRQIRAKSKVPIIMVTARSAEVDTVVGLEVGADDYISKPYRMRELVARMRSLLRRAQYGPDTVSAATPVTNEAIPISVGDVSVDVERHEVEIRGQSVKLPLREFELLTLLLENAGRVLTRDVLIERVWGYDYVGDTKTLDVHIKRLRNKVEDIPSEPRRIVTIRGLGYKYEAPKAS